MTNDAGTPGTSSESEKPYDPAEDPDSDPENLLSGTHQPDQAEGEDDDPS
ncbi:hypothetical protein [Rhodococcus sp. WAY2]|nr:hypothetical protein [Rhodococcus sp. WAY2]QHE69526.1 hypothetical protein GFS60_03094 [Rhodococcus sp. WAY2]